MHHLFIAKDGTRFEAVVEVTMIEVTSRSRPDPYWSFTDAMGHLHQWFDDTLGTVAVIYDPSHSYSTPSVVFVETGRYTDEDGEEHQTGYWACRICLEQVTPRTCADTHQRWMPGLRHEIFTINDEQVSKDEFLQRFIKAKEESDRA